MQLITRHGVEFFWQVIWWRKATTWQENLENQHLVTWFLYVPFRVTLGFLFPDVILPKKSDVFCAASQNITFNITTASREASRDRQVPEFKDHELAILGASFVLNYMDDVLRRLVIRQVGTWADRLSDWTAHRSAPFFGVSQCLLASILILVGSYLMFFVDFGWFISQF